MVQRLVQAIGAPIAGLGRVKAPHLGIARLAPIDIDMHHPFRQCENCNEHRAGAEEQKHQSRTQNMHPGMLGPPHMQVFSAPG